MSIASGLNTLGTPELPLTKLVNAIMDQKKTSETEEYIYFDPKSLTKKKLQQSGSFTNEKFKEAIVFVIGGGNYLEYQNLIDSVKKVTNY